MMDGESRALMVRPRQHVTIAEMKKLAEWAASSRKFKNVRSAQQAIILMQYGREMGIGPATALQAVYEVNGTPALKGNTIAARIKTVPWQGTNKPRYDYRIVTHTDIKCVLAFYERNDDGVLEKRGEIDYTWERAKNAGFTSGPNHATWKKHPRSMLFNRCLSEGARLFAPDCLGGIVPYTPDELGAQMDEDGEIIDAEFEQAPEEEASAELPPDDSITEAEWTAIQMDANAKQLSLANLIAEVGGDSSDLRGMTRSQYLAACKIIESK